MSNKPLYYGGHGRPIYYGGSSASREAGAGRPVMYYGSGNAYGGGMYGGAYGYYGGYGAPSANHDDAAGFVGTITFSRVCRVMAQRWLSVAVFVLLGLVVSFAVYRISPTIYQSQSEFTMQMRSSATSQTILNQAIPDYGSTYAEIFNTRISDWRSEKIVTKILQQYQADHPSSTIPDEEIISVLSDSKLELVRNSRIITITTRSKIPTLAASLANAYAAAIENFTDEENKIRCDKAVSQIHASVEKKRREVQKLATNLRDFRTANKIDNLHSMRDTLQQSLSKTTADILSLETQETQLIEWEKLLDQVKKDPETFGTLAAGIPRAQEIASEFRIFQDASTEYAKLIVAYTENHPLVIEKLKEQPLGKQRFRDATERALMSGRSSLKVVRNQLDKLKGKQTSIRDELASCEQKIVLAESGLKILDADFEVANRVLEGLIIDENKARLDAESGNEIVRVGRPATVPTKPVLPDPLLIFGVGIFLSFVIGVVFVLVIDNLEDTVVNLSDIEGRLALKVLAVLPHVRKSSREQVAKFMLSEKFSCFSETVAGLRNLLESPRYESMAKCLLFISTQPGEGKTVTSTSVAISYALSGKKTLQVDFDLRRPRLAKIWGIELEKEKSFSHNLQDACENGKAVNFDSLVNETGVDNLCVIASLLPDGVSPSTILGSKIVSDFFEWARERYDRIIVDSPPFGLVGDVVTLAMVVDSVMIMCCPDRTHFRPIQFCTKTLVGAGANILGVIVNDVEMSDTSSFMPTRKIYGSSRYGDYSYGYSPKSRDDGEEGRVVDEEMTDED